MRKGELTKRRMIETAASLMQKQGYHGTGLKQILEESRSPRGSLYFHFPDGKESLAAQALEHAGCQLQEAFTEAVQTSDNVAAALKAIIGVLRKTLVSGGFSAGCPVAAVALEMASESPMLQEVVESTYRGWESSITALLVAHGHDEEDAKGLSLFALASIEGALVLCSAYQNTEPLDEVERRLEQMLLSA